MGTARSYDDDSQENFGSGITLSIAFLQGFESNCVSQLIQKVLDAKRTVLATISVNGERINCFVQQISKDQEFSVIAPSWFFEKLGYSSMYEIQIFNYGSMMPAAE